MTKPSLSRRGTTAAALATLVAAGGVLAGCGDDDKDKSESTTKRAGVQSLKAPSTPNASSATKAAKGAGVVAQVTGTKPRGGAQPRIQGIGDQPTAQAVSTLANDIGGFWQERFNAKQLKFQGATVNVVDGSVSTACGEVKSDDGPNYCGKDNTINLPVGWFEQKAKPLGDFAIAYPIAVLWGFQIQDQLGLRDKVTGADRALMGDCLAGNWAASVFQRGKLEPGDLQEGAKLIATISGSQESNAAHVKAFNTGYNGGKAGACPLKQSG